ncbi:tRNA uracil 5 methyltransferase A [Echinococcus multilocularis]|uniref:tRNA (uracil(54)-C(5))-methyltransferase n=1 Tax=Echinococcus multilocularis TaxID=6211 RepID=A0A068YJP1_ECHMU|nr:tRNA uracil 5 methyltransferase A [Echinococcus multilocularis]
MDSSNMAKISASAPLDQVMQDAVEQTIKPSINIGTKCSCWENRSSCPPSAIPTPCSASDCVYAYLDSGQPSYERFKIRLSNVNKHITVKTMKKFLQSQGFDTSKIKPVGRGLFFITFRSAEDRDKAVEKLNGYFFKGRTLNAEVSMPVNDPILMKKYQSKTKDDQEQSHSSPSLKKRKVGNAAEVSDTADPNVSVASFYQMAYDPDQLRKKQNSAIECLKKVRNAVKKVNKFKYCDLCLESGFMSSSRKSLGPEICPIMPSPVLNGYRNKAKFTIGEDTSGKGPVVGVRLGKYREGSTAVAYPALAPIFSATTRAAVASLQACLDAIYHQLHEKESAVLFDRVAARLSVYDAVTKTGNWCDFTVRESRLGDCLMEVRIQRGNLTDGDIADLEFILKQWFQPGGPGGSVGVTSFHLVVLTGDSQLIDPLTERCVFGKDTITELCCGLKFVIAKDAFFQVNTLATEKLYEEVRRRCKAILKGEDKPVHSAILLDICCGTGTIGLCLADCFEKSVENAELNAKLNDIKNAQFYAGKAELVLKDLMRDLPEDKEIIAVLDPPRAGVNLGVIEAIRRCNRVQHLIFVACDLSRAVANFEAFARPPSRKYVGAPFFPTVASCIDLFPHTPGIEIVLSLKRLPSSDCDH